VLHSFTGADATTGFTGDTDGAHPFAGVIQGPDGNFYGTTFNGQPSATASSHGTVFKMDPAGHVTILHYFTPVAVGDGLSPESALIRARDGFFYGTTVSSLVSGGATVFRISAAGAFTKLHTFTGTERGFSTSSLLEATDGNFYGVLESGTVIPTQGLVYRITPAGSTTVLHAFASGDGVYPSDSLIQASDGNLYGTTLLGGSGTLGTVFRITNPGGVFSQAVA
jgi:uncharacterized repeat protein (TIGR03803 family)